MSAIPGKPATICGLRRSAALEAAVYLGIAWLVDEALLGGTRYRLVSPHPFWPLVLLLAVQYGTAEGIFGAAAASAILLAGHFPEQTVAQDAYDHLWTIVREPVMWFVAAVALGELRMRHVRERDLLRQELSAALERERDLSSACGRLSTVKDNLETRIAGQLRSAITIYQAARSLEKMDPSEVLLGVMDVVRIIMNPEKFSVFLLRDNVLEVSMGEGWEPSDSVSRVFRADARLFQEVIGRQRVVCAARKDDEGILGAEGILAGPLVDRETGQVIGMLKVEQIGFFELHFSNVQTFGVLCDWIADAYVNARRFQEAEADAFADPRTRLLSWAFFERQSEYLRELAGRVGFDVSTLRIGITQGDAEAEPRLRATVAAAVSRAIEPADLAFDGTRAGCLCSVIMPDTPRRDAENTARRIMLDLSQLAADTTFWFDVQSAEARPVEAARRATA